MYGQYKRITNRFDGTMTGKAPFYGGSYIRTEATGYGVVYLTKEILEHAGKDISGMSSVVTGAGNVATHVAEKLIANGVTVKTLSEREGYLHCEKGLSQEVLDRIKIAKSERRSLQEFAGEEGYSFVAGKPWQSVKADLYFPSATQNEIDLDDAQAIIDSGAVAVVEAANMPSTNEALHLFRKSDILFAPAKAANAGGVAVSGLEMSQNAGHIQWKAEDVDAQLSEIMKSIHATCLEFGTQKDGSIDYVAGANLGGFDKVRKAMLAQGM